MICFYNKISLDKAEEELFKNVICECSWTLLKCLDLVTYELILSGTSS